MLLYSLTTITSVMILMVFTVPSAVVLSVLFMRVKYSITHYLSWALSILAVIAVVICDIIFENSTSDKETFDIIIGDLLWLLGVFILAGSNVYEEWLLNKGFALREIFAYMAPTGLIFALWESFILGEISIISHMDKDDIVEWALFYLGFVIVNLMIYHFIIYFISKAGATMMNIGNLTSSVYSMIFDIFLFNGRFKWFYLIGFFFQVAAIVIYSIKDPEYPTKNDDSKLYLTFKYF